MEDLREDKGFLGKVAEVPEDVEGLFEAWDRKKDDKISWVEFREGANQHLRWRHLTRAEIEARCEDLFKRAFKAKMMGNEKDSRELARKAVSLQGSLTRDTPVIAEEKPVKKEP